MEEKQQEIKRIDSFQPDLICSLFSKMDESLNVIPNGQFFASKNNILLVSFVDQQPTGFVYAYLLDDLKSEQPSMILYSIDVFTDYRRSGIVEKLIEELKLLAEKNSCRKIFVIPDTENIPAVELYRKTGAKSSEKDDIVLVFQ